MNRRSTLMSLILALAVWLSGLGVAGAHTCMTPVDVVVGEPAVLNVGVPAEGVTPLVEVDLTIPDGFRVDDAPAVGGWQASVDGSVVRFSGGRVPGGTCGYLVVKGVATRPGTLVIAMHTRDEDGTERRLDLVDAQNPSAGQIVEARRAGDAGGRRWTGLEVATVGVAAVALTALATRRIVAGRSRR